MLPSKDEGGWLLRGLALRGLLAQAPQGEGLRAQPLIRLPAPSPRMRGEGRSADHACHPLPACGERLG